MQLDLDGDSAAPEIPDDDPVLFQLARQALVAKGAAAAVGTLVSIARQRGRTWAEIATALGVTKQAAHRHYRYLRSP